MKNKKLLLLALPFVSMVLASCADTDELYDQNLYIGGGGSFNTNWYHENALSGKTINKDVASYTADQAHRYMGSGLSGEVAYVPTGETTLLSGHPEDVKASDGVTNLQWTYNGWSIDYSSPGVWKDQSAVVDILYGQNKKMNLIQPSFSNGILSKIYNGQIQCDSWNSYAYIQLDKSGYGTIFPDGKELSTSKSFSFVVRGGSNTHGIPTGTVGYYGPEDARYSKYDINVSFYKYVYESNSYDEYVFSFPDIILQTNISAEQTSLLTVYFADFGFDPKGVCGMSITYSLSGEDVFGDGKVISYFEDDTQGLNPFEVFPSDDMSDDNEYHNCLMLYEVMFPGSTWY